jgi:hypothetical protein
VENCGKVAKVGEALEALSVCSGCAGDYEDPERTAGEEFEELLAELEEWPADNFFTALGGDAEWVN